jgi:hypothetical protein
MFASHLIAAPKAPAEIRVVLIGDSSIWGENLGASEVISEQWNRMNRQCGEKTITAYNLGYPHPSVLKDLVILDKALEYDPDLVVWFVTLNTLVSQRVNPFLIANRGRAVDVLESYEISFRQGEQLTESRPGIFEKTLVGQRVNLARRIKLEMLGLIWTATGADTNTLAEEDPLNFEIGDDLHFRGLTPADDIGDQLLLSALGAGHDMSAPIPMLVVNEPMYIAPGWEGLVRYNASYPRWAYDRYREVIASEAQRAGWNYLDLWNAVPPGYFSDAGLHLVAQGVPLLIERVDPVIQSMVCAQNS